MARDGRERGSSNWALPVLTALLVRCHRTSAFATLALSSELAGGSARHASHTDDRLQPEREHRGGPGCCARSTTASLQRTAALIGEPIDGVDDGRGLADHAGRLAARSSTLLTLHRHAPCVVLHRHAPCVCRAAQLVSQFGKQWRKIAERLPSRSADSVRNRCGHCRARPAHHDTHGPPAARSARLTGTTGCKRDRRRDVTWATSMATAASCATSPSAAMCAPRVQRPRNRPRPWAPYWARRSRARPAAVRRSRGRRARPVVDKTRWL